MFSHLSKFFIPILALAIVLGTILLKPFHTAEKSHHETLVIGLQSGYPPFEFMDADGEVVGFDIDIAELLAKKLNKILVVHDMEFDGEILSLKQGKIDLILSGMDITPSRLKEIAMIPYHGQAMTALSLIFWQEIPEGVHSIEDIKALPNPTISAQSGSTSETYLNQIHGVQIKTFDGALSPLLDVKYGKSAANLVEPSVAEYLQKKHAEIKIVNIPLSEEYIILGCGIGVKKENKELCHQIQEAIQELKTSGELQQLEDKWFKGVN